MKNVNDHLKSSACNKFFKGKSKHILIQKTKDALFKALDTKHRDIKSDVELK